MVKTEIMANIPMVTPSNDKIVRSKLAFNACQANRKLSNMSRRYITMVFGKLNFLNLNKSPVKVTKFAPQF
jgi:hypothetical protein